MGTVTGYIKEKAGKAREEFNEHSSDPTDIADAAKGRALRNEGLLEQGKAPKTTPVGGGH